MNIIFFRLLLMRCLKLFKSGGNRTRVILYLNYAASQGYKSAVVRTPDTDLFFFSLSLSLSISLFLSLLHYAQLINLKIILDIGSGEHCQLIDISELSNSLGQEYCSTLLAYHVYSGKDCTSAFKGKGKLQGLKKPEGNPKYHFSFR